MKRVFTFLFACLLWAQSVPAQTGNSQLLRNHDVLAMVEAKLTPAVIVAKIENSSCAFDTGPAVLQELKAKGVAEEIILAMLRANPPGPNTSGNYLAGTAKTVKIPADTPVQLVTVGDINSEVVRTGDTLTFRVAVPVIIDGVIVIDDGALAFGRVTKAVQGRSFGRAGKLDWAMTEIMLADKSKAPISFSRHVSGVSKGGTVAATAVLTGLIFPPLAIISGFKRGRPAIVPGGTSFQVFIKEDTTVTVAPNR